jgi:predicted transcriptional regulator
MKSSSMQQGVINRHLILSYLKLQGKWVSGKTIAQELNIDMGAVHCHCRNWIAAGMVEESLIKRKTHLNQPPRNVIHYRTARFSS